jgi:putative heme-binding domain-containing protein
VPLLRHPSPQIQFCAAEALARCGGSNDVPALLERLSDDSDRFLEHSLVYGLYRLANTKQLTAALEHANPRVQRAALVLLDQPPHRALARDAVVKRAFTDDEPLRRAAQACLRNHPAWVEQAVAVVSQMMSAGDLTTAQLDSLRGFVVAFNQQPAIVSLVAKTVSDGNGTGESLRVVLLDAMSRTPRDQLPAAWRDAFATALASKSVPVRRQALLSINTLRLDGMENELRVIAGDRTADIPLRVDALRALIRQQFSLNEEALAVLFSELARTNSGIRRLAAAEVLSGAHMDSGRIARFVTAVKGDAMISPASVIGALPKDGLGDPDAGVLLDYLTAGVKSGWQLSEAQLAAVASVIPTSRKAELTAIRDEMERATGRQGEQLTAMETLLRGGNAERGRLVFEQRAGCASCHQTSGRGGILGPDLTKIGAIRAGRDLVESVVIPSATFAQGYETYTARLSDGEAVTGIRVQQSDDAFVLRGASGSETRIPGGVEIGREKISLMPDGLLSALTDVEIRDLFAYLQSLK